MHAEGRASFEDWARARQDGLVRAAFLLTGDFARAEDLVQEALIRAALRWDTLRDGQPDAWIRTVIYRENISRWRRTRRERLTADPPEPVRSYPTRDADVAMSLRAALESLTHKQRATTPVADTAWPLARGRLRRRRAVAVGASILAAASALVLGTHVDLLGPDEPEPATDTPTPTPSSSEWWGNDQRVSEKITDRRLLTHQYYALAHGSLIDMSSPGRLVLLSTDPLPYAALAISERDRPTDVKVLGPAGEIRAVNVPGLVPVRDAGGYKSGILRPTALSPDATRLALPQPHALVVVDLSTGNYRRITTPGLNYYADWTDGAHVYVAAENGDDASIVNVDEQTVQPTDLPPGTAFLPDDTVTWGSEAVLDFGQGEDVRAAGGNNGGYFYATPLLGPDVAIGVHAVTSYQAGSGDALIDTVGLLAVDRHDGHAIGFLATTRGAGTDARAIGWYQGLPVISFTPEQESVPMRWLITWDPETRAITPLATIYASEVAWGRGLTPATLP